MTMTLLASNESGALVGNEDGNATFLNARHLAGAANEIIFTMPKVTGKGALGIVVPDFINFGPSRFIDYKPYIADDGNLTVKAAFDPEARIWFVEELPQIPSILRLA